MAALNLSGAMDDLANAVQTVLTSGRTARAYPAEGMQPGDALVSYPEAGGIRLTQTFHRGLDSVTVPVYVIGGLPQDLATRDAISGWLDDSGSVITAIEGYSSSYWSSAMCKDPSIEVVDPIGGSPWLALKVLVELLA